MTRTLIGLALTGLLASACATADPYAGYAPDQPITEAEFMAGVDQYGAFALWDANNDGYLSAAEFEAGMRSIGLTARHGFTSWDRNEDNRLSESEFYRGTFRDLSSSADGVVTARDIAENRYLVAW